MTPSIGNTQLLRIWEQAAHQRPARRSACLLAGTADDADAVGALPVGERDRRLLLLRKELFGDQIEGVAECPTCHARIELIF